MIREDANEVFEKINYYYNKGEDFLFVIDYENRYGIFSLLNDIERSYKIIYNFNGITNENNISIENKNCYIARFSPILYQEYCKGFNIIIDGIRKGYSYLANYTCVTKIELSTSLLNVYYNSKAKYKLFVDDVDIQFVVFSPERFIMIKDQIIFSNPMKGTIDANISNALDVIINDDKETGEHATIVDLIRNDLSQIAINVRVNKYRYPDYIRTSNKLLIQISSEIVGTLQNYFVNNIGYAFKKLLPAGSICGAPKESTIKLIKLAERYDRGFYTGIMGVSFNKVIDSAVMIRFIEQIDNQKYYKSGGGITYLSNPLAEYNEMIDKIYIPLK